MKKLFTLKAGDKFYNRPPAGFSPCIIGNYPYNSNKRTGIKGLNVLPNCVGYATGRFNQLIGEDKCKYLGNTDAKYFADLAKRQGLKTGTEPKVGACICWGDNTHGHVAIVEKVISDTEIMVSQSGWNYKGGDIWFAVHTKGDGNWVLGDDYGWMKNKYKFICFIYPPEKEFTAKLKTVKIEYEGKVYDTNGIYYDGTNYVRLRDFDDILNIFKVEYNLAEKRPVIKKE